MQVAGGEPEQLSFFQNCTTHRPVWSPDGQRLAFISDQNGTPRVWTISANGENPQAIENSDASGTNGMLAWWPSRDIIYQQPGLRNFLRISDKTKKEKSIIQRDQSVGWVPRKPVFSPDGRKMAVWWNRRRETELWIISLQPYSETQWQHGMICPFGWSPDGKYVYAMRGQDDQTQELVRVQAATPHEVTSVAALPGPLAVWDGASVSPDGKTIVVSIGEWKSDVWLMESFDPSVREPNPN